MEKKKKTISDAARNAIIITVIILFNILFFAFVAWMSKSA